MQEINPATVNKIAHLANLDMSQEEIAQYTGQLEKILEYVRKLQELDTKNVAQTAHVLAIKNVWRKDEISPSLSREAALAAAPEVWDQFFRVPRIIE